MKTFVVQLTIIVDDEITDKEISKIVNESVEDNINFNNRVIDYSLSVNS